MNTISTDALTDALYRSEDAQQILKIAIDRQAEAGELTRAQLFEIALELNIAPADLVAAEQEWLLKQGERTERQTFDRMRRDRFRSHVIKSVIMGGFFVVMSALTGWGWLIYPVWFLAARLALAAWKTYFLSEEDYLAAFQQWRQRQHLKRSVTGLVNRWLGVQ